MPLPLIWIVGAVAVAAAKKGIDAGLLLKEAADTKKAADTLKEDAEQRLASKVEAVEAEGLALEAQKLAVMELTVARFVQLWERQKKKNTISDKDFALHLEMTPETLAEFKRVGFRSLELAGGLIQAAAAGLGTSMAVTSAVSALGTAGTGAAISGLSGAAANSALLAWLGGGTLASGGGGMALGAIVAGGLLVAPAALVGSLIVAKKGEEALTAATQYFADVEVYCAQLEVKQAGLDGIQARIQEISELIGRVVSQLRKALTVCEADEAQSDGKVELPHFYAAASLAKALVDLLMVPVIDDDAKALLAYQQTVDAAQQTATN